MLEKIFNDFREWFKSFEVPSVPVFGSDVDLFSVFVAVTGILLAWLAYRIARIQLKLQENDLSRVLDSPILKFMGYSPSSRFVFFAPFATKVLGESDDRTFAFPLEFSIRNETHESMDDVELYIKMSAEHYKEEIIREPGPISSARGMLTGVEMIDGTRVVTIYYRVGHIPPNTTIKIEERLFSQHPTDDLDFTTDVTSLDGVDLRVGAQISVSIAADVTVTARNRPTVTSRIKIGLRTDFHGDIMSYLGKRVKDGKVPKVDSGTMVYVRFKNFSEPDYSKKARQSFIEGVKQKEPRHLQAIKELAERRNISLAKAKADISSGVLMRIVEGSEYTTHHGSFG